jgi:hypothetical protein
VNNEPATRSISRRDSPPSPPGDHRRCHSPHLINELERSWRRRSANVVPVPGPSQNRSERIQPGCHHPGHIQAAATPMAADSRRIPASAESDPASLLAALPGHSRDHPTAGGGGRAATITPRRKHRTAGTLFRSKVVSR